MKNHHVPNHSAMSGFLHSIFSIFLLIFSSITLAADCSNPPSGFGGKWARAYRNWCESCGGTYSSNGPSCAPGSNWGGGQESTSPTYNYEQERQRQEADRLYQEEQERRRQSELEEQKRREDEARKKQEEFESNKVEALKSMKGISEHELGLKGVDTGSDLGLKDIGNAGTDNLGLKDAASTETGDHTKKGGAVKVPIDKEGQQSASFQKGLRDASQCFESNAQVYCLSAPAKQQHKCVETYTAGFNSGMEYQKMLLNGASYYGKKDKEDGKSNQSFNHPDANGPCRVKWIERYNSGYFAAKTSINNKQ